MKLPRIHLQWARGGGAEVAAPGRASSELAGATLSLADLVLPDAVDAGRFPDRVYVPPDRWIRVYAVKALPDRLSVGWLSELLATEGVDLSVQVEPVARPVAVRDLSRAIRGMKGELEVRLRRGDEAGLSLLDQEVADYEELRRRVEVDEDGLYRLVIAVRITAASPDALAAAASSFEDRCASIGVYLHVLAFDRQEAGLRAHLPLPGWELGDLARNFTRGSCAASLPLTGADWADPGGVFLGSNGVTGGPLFWDPWVGPPRRTNYNVAVMGEQGSGKSHLCKALICRQACFGVRTAVLDREGEYARVLPELGGCVITVHPDRPSGINPFEVGPDTDDAGQSFVPLRAKVEELKAWIHLLLGGPDGLAVPQEEMAEVEQALWACYRNRGIGESPASLVEEGAGGEDGFYLGGRPKPRPTFSDFHQALSARGKSAQRAARILRSYCREGSLGLFDCETAVTLGEQPLLAIDIRALEAGFLQTVGTHAVLSWLWQWFVNRRPELRKIVLIDEAWVAMKNADTAAFVETLARRARKRNTCLLVASQQFREFTARPEGQAVLANAGTLFLGRQEDSDAPAVAEVFGLSQGQANLVLDAGPGDFLLKAGREIAALHVDLTEGERALFETDPNRRPGLAASAP